MELTLAKHNRRLSSKAYGDYQLVKSAVNGNQKAFAKLLERYRPAVYSHIFKMVQNEEDAEDLTIEAFGKAFNKIATYQPNFAFSTWLFKIAVNNCIDHVRKKRLKVISMDAPMADMCTLDYKGTISAPDLNPEEVVIRQQRLEMVNVMLLQLNHKYRQMIQLRYYEELSYEEIANQVGIPLGTVKAQLFRAKEMLFVLMQKPAAADYLETTRRLN